MLSIPRLFVVKPVDLATFTILLYAEGVVHSPLVRSKACKSGDLYYSVIRGRCCPSIPRLFIVKPVDLATFTILLYAEGVVHSPLVRSKACGSGDLYYSVIRGRCCPFPACS